MFFMYAKLIDLIIFKFYFTTLAFKRLFQHDCNYIALKVNLFGSK